jgi:hypothetical protein
LCDALRGKEPSVSVKDPAWERYESEMLAHLAKSYPVDMGLLGTQNAKAVIAFGAARAQSHGFNSARQLCRYTSLMIGLGSRFDADPQLPWAAPILRSTSRKGPDARLDDLSERAAKHLTAVSGFKGMVYLRALARARGRTLEMLPSVSPRGAEDALAPLFASLYPEKARLIEGTLGLLVKIAEIGARRYKLGEGHPFALYATLMFLLGAGFDEDPQFPWAGQVLNDSRTPSPLDKVRALADAGLAWLGRALPRD